MPFSVIMTIDVCILAGGLGTRLRGIWDRPKCLVPIDGKPLLHHLLDKIAPLHPRIVNLCLGVGATEVLWYCLNTKLPVDVRYTVEAAPLGSVNALQLALPAVSPPLLVLNGDTLPMYPLVEIVDACLGRSKKNLMLNFDLETDCTWKDSLAFVEQGSPDPTQNVGAFFLRANFLLELRKSTDSDMRWLVTKYCKRLVVEGVALDVGTPKGFEQATRGVAKL